MKYETFKEFWLQLTADEKRDLAKSADTSVAYLGQVANSSRNAGRKTIANLLKADERITYGMLGI